MWYAQHKRVERNFLASLDSNSPLILKGGTALMFCYGLDRFSEDLDFDAIAHANTERYVKSFCSKNGYSYFRKKYTDTVQRLTIHYGGEKPLKIETSFRDHSLSLSDTISKNNIRTYPIDTLAQMKMTAFMSRDRIRDLYDVSFITNNYWEELSQPIQRLYRTGFAEKGIEQFDLMCATQDDDLINKDSLAESFLKALDKAKIFHTTEEVHQYRSLAEEMAAAKAAANKQKENNDTSMQHSIRQ